MYDERYQTSPNVMQKFKCLLMQNGDHILAFFLENEPPQISPQLQTQKYNQSVLSPKMVNKYEKCLSDAKTLQCV